MQAGAWTGMLISRAQSGSIVSAVKTTFDGDHPCSMCKLVSKGVAEDSAPKTPSAKKTQEIKMVASIVSELPSPAFFGFAEWPQVSESAASRADAPPTPPPLA